MTVLDKHLVLREQDNEGYLRKYSEADTGFVKEKALLEGEIRLLRSMMERAAELEQSMTSDLVVHLSGLLDKKINEYMKFAKLDRRKS